MNILSSEFLCFYFLFVFVACLLGIIIVYKCTNMARDTTRCFACIYIFNWMLSTIGMMSLFYGIRILYNLIKLNII
jgi:hypothetical protein